MYYFRLLFDCCYILRAPTSNFSYCSSFLYIHHFFVATIWVLLTISVEHKYYKDWERTRKREKITAAINSFMRRWLFQHMLWLFLLLHSKYSIAFALIFIPSKRIHQLIALVCLFKFCEAWVLQFFFLSVYFSDRYNMVYKWKETKMTNEHKNHAPRWSIKLSWAKILNSNHTRNEYSAVYAYSV